jgi:hypothetical protein
MVAFRTMVTPFSALAAAAVVALVAFVAESALVACVALGTVSPFVLIFAAPTAWFLIFGDVTAFFFNCFAPMLFFGRLVAAYAVPPSATNSAIRAPDSAPSTDVSARSLL